MSEIKKPAGLEPDNPDTPDEPEQPINEKHQIEIARKLALGADPADIADDLDDEDDEDTEDEGKEKPAEEKPAEKPEDAPETPEAEDKPEAEAEAEPPVYTQAQVEQMVQDSVQKAVNAIVAKERKRSDNALKVLREIEVATGLTADQLKQQGLQHLKAEAIERYAMSEEDAERYAQEQQELRRLKAERAEAAQREQEREAETKYVKDRTAFLADPKADPIEKEIVQKYLQEIDEFADSGKIVDFETASAYVRGKRLAEFWRERESKIKQATEQKTLKAVQEREKSRPESAAASGKDDSLPQLTATQRQVARQMRPDLPPKEAEERYRKALAAQKKR